MNMPNRYRRTISVGQVSSLDATYQRASIDDDSDRGLSMATSTTPKQPLHRQPAHTPLGSRLTADWAATHATADTSIESSWKDSAIVMGTTMLSGMTSRYNGGAASYTGSGGSTTTHVASVSAAHIRADRRRQQRSMYDLFGPMLLHRAATTRRQIGLRARPL
jgi:hypothetical protein